MAHVDAAAPKKLLSNNKRNVLVGKLCRFCAILATMHLALDAYMGLYDSVVVDLAFIAVVGISYLLAQKGFPKISKIFVLFALNFLFILFASVLPKEVGVYLYYFPLMVASSVLFDSREKHWRFIFVGLTFALLLLLFVTDFDLFFGTMHFQQPVDRQMYFMVNAVCSASILILCINFMQNLNESSERELKQLAEEVHAKNIHLEKANAELDRFMYSTSHDLRSPLSSIKGLVNIARYETTDPKLQGYFSMMIDRVDKLDFFIKDIIDYSKNARTEIRVDSVNLSSLLEEVTENLRFVEGAAGIEFTNTVHIDYPVQTDRNRLGIVLNNLMANAIKYHDPVKGKKWINVEVSNSNANIRLTVADNGMGIGKEHQDKIFDMFYRGTFQSQGSGLGLYIVKETIAKMKGTIRVESAPGVGSSFFITVPVS